MKFIPILLLISIAKQDVYSQAVKNQKKQCFCNLAVVRNTNKNLRHLTTPNIYAFLSTFDTSCRNNFEYTEYSNDVLFKILTTNPRLLVDALEKYADLHKGYIYMEISNPLLDYNFKEIIQLVERTCQSGQVKEKVISKLQSIGNNN